MAQLLLLLLLQLPAHMAWRLAINPALKLSAMERFKAEVMAKHQADLAETNTLLSNK